MPRVKSCSAADLPTDFEALVRLHPPCAIHDKVGYDNALEMVDRITCLPELSSGQTLYLETLGVLVEAYEEEFESLAGKMPPIQLLRHLMEERDMSVSDLGRLLGERSLGSKLLAGQRELSKTHIRILADHFGVRADLFL